MVFCKLLLFLNVYICAHIFILRSVFKTKATKIKEGLAAADISAVAINEDKPRRGAFVVSVSGEPVVELLGLTRPFGKLRELDLDETVQKIVTAAKK
jgi:hypothetical protein